MFSPKVFLFTLTVLLALSNLDFTAATPSGTIGPLSKGKGGSSRAPGKGKGYSTKSPSTKAPGSTKAPKSSKSPKSTKSPKTTKSTKTKHSETGSAGNVVNSATSDDIAVSVSIAMVIGSILMMNIM